MKASSFRKGNPQSISTSKEAGLSGLKQVRILGDLLAKLAYLLVAPVTISNNFLFALELLWNLLQINKGSNCLSNQKCFIVNTQIKRGGMLEETKGKCNCGTTQL